MLAFLDTLSQKDISVDQLSAKDALTCLQPLRFFIHPPAKQSGGSEGAKTGLSENAGYSL